MYKNKQLSNLKEIVKKELENKLEIVCDNKSPISTNFINLPQ